MHFGVRIRFSRTCNCAESFGSAVNVRAGKVSHYKLQSSVKTIGNVLINVTLGFVRLPVVVTKQFVLKYSDCVCRAGNATYKAHAPYTIFIFVLFPPCLIFYIIYKI